MWKEALLEGRVDMGVARQAGRLLALMMAAPGATLVRRPTFADAPFSTNSASIPIIEPPRRGIPMWRPVIEKLIEDSWRIRTAIVHGDYSPKNLLVKGGDIFLIDFEVVHWGDPAFDAGFLLNHLFLKAFHQPRFGRLYFAAAREFGGNSAKESRARPSATLRNDTPASRRPDAGAHRWKVARRVHSRRANERSGEGVCPAVAAGTVRDSRGGDRAAPVRVNSPPPQMRRGGAERLARRTNHALNLIPSGARFSIREVIPLSK